MAIWPLTETRAGGDLTKRKGKGQIMRHDVSSATQTVKSEKGGGRGGGGESRVKWTVEADLGGAQFIFVP